MVATDILKKFQCVVACLVLHPHGDLRMHAHAFRTNNGGTDNDENGNTVREQVEGSHRVCREMNYTYNGTETTHGECVLSKIRLEEITTMVEDINVIIDHLFNVIVSPQF